MAFKRYRVDELAREAADAATTAALTKHVRVAEKPKPKMNKTEAAYAEVLEMRRKSGEIREYAFALLTIRLGDDLRFTPDFTVIAADGTLELHEVKGGFIRDDARVKLRAAAAATPFRYVLAQYTKAEGWQVNEVPA